MTPGIAAMLASLIFKRGFKKSTRRVDIVLLKDHERLGLKGGVNRVKPGYMRNYLYPNGIAVYATDENIVKYASWPEDYVSMDGKSAQNAE